MQPPFDSKVGRQIIPPLGNDRFTAALAEEFDNPEDVVPGPPTVYPGGVVYYPIGSTHCVLETPAGWSLYETADETAWRAHVAAWGDFARGTWTRRVPEKPGTYPVRNRTGARMKDHIFLQKGDLVYDVDSGHLRPGVRTNWVGDFWSMPYPPLPGAV